MMNSKSKNTKGHERYGLERLNARTDGVVAIAITLLVLGIDIPTDHDFTVDGLRLFLIELEPGLIAYTISFIVIAVYWSIHHRIYSVVAFSNNRIVVLNLIFLFSISLIPFIAKIKSLYKYDLMVIIIYSFAHFITGLILYATWKHFMAQKVLLKYDINEKKSRIVSMSILCIPVISLIAISSAFINVHIATYMFYLVPILYIYLFRLSKPLFEDKDYLQSN